MPHARYTTFSHCQSKYIIVANECLVRISWVTTVVTATNKRRCLTTLRSNQVKKGPVSEWWGGFECAGVAPRFRISTDSSRILLNTPACRAQIRLHFKPPHWGGGSARHPPTQPANYFSFIERLPFLAPNRNPGPQGEP